MQVLLDQLGQLICAVSGEQVDPLGEGTDCSKLRAGEEWDVGMKMLQNGFSNSLLVGVKKKHNTTAEQICTAAEAVYKRNQTCQTHKGSAGHVFVSACI